MDSEAGGSENEVDSDEYVLGGSPNGQWACDWSCELEDAQFRRNLPEIHAALAAFSQGLAVASPHMRFLLLDAAILLGQAETVAKLINDHAAPVPLRAWRAVDFLSTYERDPAPDAQGGKEQICVGELCVIHAAACAGLDLSSLVEPSHFDWPDIRPNLLEAVMQQGYTEVAKAMVRAGSQISSARPEIVLRQAYYGDFQALQCAFALGLPVCNTTLESLGRKHDEGDVLVTEQGANDGESFDNCERSGEEGFRHFRVGSLDCAILHGEKELALRLANADVDVTLDGIILMRRQIFYHKRSGPENCEATVDAATAVLKLQRQRNLAKMRRVAGLPLLQLTGGPTRGSLPIVEYICSFAEQLPALAHLGESISGVGCATAAESADLTSIHPPEQSTHAGAEDDAKTMMDEGADAQVDQAIKLSNDDADRQESEQVVAAVLQSKIDTPPVSGDDAVIFRLTRVTHTISETLLQVPELAEARARVIESGCELRPGFAGGAILLIPITKEQFEELGLTLAPHHIVALRVDKSSLEVALSCVPSKQRPKLKPDHRADPNKSDTCTDLPAVPESHVTVDGQPSRVVVVDDTPAHLFEERAIGTVIPIVRYTFIHFPDPENVSEIGGIVRSAPCGSSDDFKEREPVNPRRYNVLD